MLRRMFWSSVGWLAAVLLAGAQAAGWGDFGAWQPLPLPGVETRTVYESDTEDGRSVVRSDSRCSASALAVPLERVDLEATPLLRWSWKIEQPLAPREERVKAGDDFAARVYLTFRFDPRGASWGERLRNRIGRSIYGREVPGRALNYVWTSSEPAGESWDNPFAPASKMISLGSGPLPEWRSQEVNVVRDYQRFFEGDLAQPLGLAIMTDSDNSCSRASAWFADFAFAPAPAAEGLPE